MCKRESEINEIKRQKCVRERARDRGRERGRMERMRHRQSYKD